ncbi:pseudouridine synthase [Mesotoga sp. Brook.08.YT.4.2.5.1]|uniref:Pseudouridine synthase n=1 Tax=Mesotoga prima TaxID=1184387 RepID=A0A124FYJ3_9BACT|nr:MULTISPECIES: RluA family pseudouridine synthase [unclassified Mesotoga]KUK81385.1 MAG: Pseudouridine synthase [Mesotoga prima]PNE23093.1 pseudouridine synthase [Mesotoga sp. Brook.08.YT.4.2.5.1]PVD15834.1 RNA pseudouridine synthase [Mesotoga sp. Brook.08.105.5.1]RAO97857.1 pseudouridine synthase [Mesotoga sp. Brook.08.YT.4.2.5.4.]RDI93859.1 pseudouridine synthase [Mesotoga sp. Brook.08.YT.4.2.5.2.]
MLQEITVSRREDGWRLDKIVVEKAPPWISRTFVQRQIMESKVFVDGRARKPAYKVKSGEIITFELPDKPQILSVEPEDIPLDIIFEDRDIIVVNKEPGIIVHPLPRKQTGTLVNALLNHCGDLQGIGGVTRPGIVHRLDKDTSGVIIVAKNDLAHVSLSSQFKNRLTSKDYLALVKGKTPASGKIDYSIARHPVNRLKMSINCNGKESLTNFRTLRNFSELASLVLVSPKTGRTHQIRVHMKEKGFPLLGDAVYGKARDDEIFGVRRQMLHALRLTVLHPRSGRRMTFLATLPEDMKEAIVNLSELVEKKA